MVAFFGLVGLTVGALLAFVAALRQFMLWALVLGAASLVQVRHAGEPLAWALLCAACLFVCMQLGYAAGIALRGVAGSGLPFAGKSASGWGARRRSDRTGGSIDRSTPV